MYFDLLEEQERSWNFVRVFPAKGSNFYEKFFIQRKWFNHLIYKMLFGDIFIVEQ